MPKTAPVYQLKVTLQDTRPPVWRRIQVRSDVTLAELHRILQEVMGWSGGHLHLFDVGGEQYGEPHPGDWEPLKNERRVRLSRLMEHPKDRIDYVYDFGDDWRHRIVLEKVLRDVELAHPVCLAGKRACPPEDCGGPYGYQDLLAILGDPGHPQHEEYREWVEDDFDPERFSADEINVHLQGFR